MPTISMWIYFSKGLYADFAINIYYFVIAIYGYVIWTRGKRKSGNPGKQEKEKKDDELPITNIGRKELTLCVAGFLVLWGGIYAVLEYMTDSNVPMADAFTTALSIVGMWMLAKKYIEQWIAWIAVDAVCVGLYIYKGIYLYALLYLIYTVIAVLGYRKWQKLRNN